MEYEGALQVWSMEVLEDFSPFIDQMQLGEGMQRRNGRSKTGLPNEGCMLYKGLVIHNVCAKGNPHFVEGELCSQFVGR